MTNSKTNDGNDILRNTKIPDVPLGFVKTTAITATPISTLERDGIVVLKADENNTGDIFIGDSAVSTSNGFKLATGIDFPLAISNISNVYFIGENTSDKLYGFITYNRLNETTD